METIEIGLVVIDLESLEIVDEFQQFVRPQINPTKGLKQTLESLGLVWEDVYHRGIDDARNVSAIVKEILS